MYGLPESLYIVILFLFGVIIGSFLNVVIYRLHTGKSLNDRSHCLSCGATLAWYELFPLISYLVLLGRCRNCGSWIPGRYWAVELGTGLLFIAVGMHELHIGMLVPMLIVVASLMVAVVYDLRHLIIPDEIVAITIGAVCMYVLLGEGRIVASDLSIVVLAGALAFFAYALLWYVSAGRWLGLGDAKLAFPLGMLLGINHIFSFVVLSFWIGALVSLAFIALRYVSARGQNPLQFSAIPLTIKSEIPFAPFLVAAFLLVFFYGLDVLEITAYGMEIIYNLLF